MSFKLKTIMGVAVIEASLLMFLVWSSIDYISKTSADELSKRASTIASSLANLASDAVLSTDLARLESIATRAMDSPDLMYIRFIGFGKVLASAGDKQVLSRPFALDDRVEQVSDGIYDFSVNLQENGHDFGRVELGLALSRADEFIATARRHLLGIAVVEMILVALFSYILGSYLTRGLDRLRVGASAVADGQLGITVKANSTDELGSTISAFNRMSLRLLETNERMQNSIDEGRELSQKLQEQEQKTSAVLSTAVDGFVILGPTGDVVDINPAGAELFGYEAEEIQGINIIRLVADAPPGAPGGDRIALESFEDANTDERLREARGLRKDGSEFDLEIAVSTIQIERRRSRVALLRDISSRKKLEAEARRNEAMKSAIIDSNLDALVTIDIDETIIEFSPVAEEVFGYSREYAIGRRMPELLIPAHLRSAHENGFEHYKRTREGPVLGQRVEVEAKDKDGRIFPVELTVQPIEVNGEQMFTASIRDITARKRAETELMEAKNRAESASAAKSQFLAHMSHEIRSPLNAVLGSLNLLMEDELSSDQRIYAQTAVVSGNTLLGLINDVLDFSKIEAGELVLEYSDFDIRNVVNESVDLVAVKSREKGVPLAVVFEEGIWPLVHGDSLRLRQILVNLIDNAIKFTRAGAVVVRIRKTSENSETTTLKFIVEDTGIGIAEEAQANLFDEFQQVDSSDSTNYGGTGLGLSICRNLAVLMGGHIGVESRLGSGSRFWIELPFERGNPGVDGLAGNAFNTKLNIVAVGFHEVISRALTEQCNGVGCNLVCAENVPAAQSSLGPSVDGVLIDASMPTEDIVSFSEYARSKCDPRIILVVTQLSARLAELVKTGVCDEILLTPLVLERVVETMHAAVEPKLNVDIDSSMESSVREHTSARPLVLLAEDSKANQMIATAMLKRAGYEVEVVADGEHAVLAVESQNFDLILMDLRMPGMDGISATRVIRTIPGAVDVPIIALTANAFKEDVERCRKVGMNDFVPKPIDRDRLLKTIQKHLKSDSGTADESETADASRESPGRSASALLIDPEVIEQLARDTSPEDVPEMFKLFVEEAQVRASRIEEALKERSKDKLEIEAHTLKGCAGSFGAIRMHNLAREIEFACREQTWHAAASLSREMAAVTKDTVNAVKAELKFND